jgi:hypothetical protein
VAVAGKCLEMEFLLAQQFMRGSDFFEGVGKMLNLNGEGGRDATRHWAAASVEEVAEETVAEYFAPGDGTCCCCCCCCCCCVLCYSCAAALLRD